MRLVQKVMVNHMTIMPTHTPIIPIQLLTVAMEEKGFFAKIIEYIIGAIHHTDGPPPYSLRFLASSHL